MRVILLLPVLLLLPSLCLADLLPDNWKDAERRAKDKDYDVADQFCAGKAIGTRCEVPGNPFQGGGDGVCTLSMPNGNLTASCKLNDPAKIDRRVPKDGWRLSKGLCATMSPEEIRKTGFACNDVPAVTDQFCSKKADGDPCSAEVWQRSGWSTHPGRCVREAQLGSYYPLHPNESGGSIVREALLCRSENTVVRTFESSSPPGLLKRVFQ